MMRAVNPRSAGQRLPSRKLRLMIFYLLASAFVHQSCCSPFWA